MLAAAQAHLPPELRRLVWEYADDTLVQYINAQDNFLYAIMCRRLANVLSDEDYRAQYNERHDAWHAYFRLHGSSLYPCLATSHHCVYSSYKHGGVPCRCRADGYARLACPEMCALCGFGQFLRKPE